MAATGDLSAEDRQALVAKRSNHLPERMPGGDFCLGPDVALPGSYGEKNIPGFRLDGEVGRSEGDCVAAGPP